MHLAESLRGYQKMVEVEKNGGRPVNRLRSMNQAERKKEKTRKKTKWYKKGENETVLFVPCTPGGTLAKRMRAVEERGREDRGWNVKIVEMGGQTLKDKICKSNPWAGKLCGHEQCFSCMNGYGGDCRRKNVGYKITCSECKSEYHGETSRTMLCRGKEHMKGLLEKKKESVLWEHSESVHEGWQIKYRMQATGYFSEPLTRQINEAVRIFNTTNNMNRKNEWKKTAIPKATFERQ